MKFSTSILLSIFTALTSKVIADCTYDRGNYYCDEVSAVVYNNVGYSGTYQDVTNMDETSCSCTQSSKSFSGTNSPLDEELSVHFRGPIKLLQFGVYYPSSSSSKQKREEDNECTTTRAQHGHHVHKRATEIVEITQTVYVDSNGNIVTDKGAGATSTSTSSSQVVVTAAGAAAKANVQDNASSNTKTQTTLSSTQSTSGNNAGTSTSSSAASASSGSSSSSSAWTRGSYYKPGTAENVVFLNTKGGTNGSGTWSSCFGNSLSYAAENGVDSASSATTLGEVTFSSDQEFVIFSGQSCSSSSSQGTECGYYRSNIPAYHGFGGAEKIFVFEFEMPTDSSSSGASNPDMPAVWLLNAKIPRTLQYGSSSCSCWGTGCGELDLFEILSQGSTKLISHIHDGQGNDGSSTGGGGSQDYFTRPTSGSFKGACIFNSDKSIHIVQLDGTTSFDSGLDSTTVNTWLSKAGGSASLS